MVRGRIRFGEIRDSWNRLATSSLFLTWEWLDCWWQHFGEGAELRIQAVWDATELLGGVALAARGRHVSAFANKETDLFAPLVQDERQMAFVLEHMATQQCSRLTLAAVPVECRTAERVTEALRANGWLVDQTFRERCPIIDTSMSLAEYRSRLSSNARRQLGKARRRLEREGSVELSAVDELDRAVALEPLLDESSSKLPVGKAPRVARLDRIPSGWFLEGSARALP